MTPRPRVLLLSPGIVRRQDADFGLPHLVALGGWLERELPVQVVIRDLGYEGWDQSGLRAAVAQLAPLLVGISCYSSFDWLRCLALARFLRRAWPELPLVAGGYHAAACPTELLPPHGPFDAVVVGEGERPFTRLVAALLGGAGITTPILGPEPVPELDALPPLRWDLLERYWPHSRSLGRKLQIHLSRGCPYHCSFCMERAKGAQVTWRAYSPARALDELARLDRHAELAGWLVNLADPLFGLAPGWRRAVLEGILRRGLRPRHYWTLTRLADLTEEDIALLARARVAVGGGLESGSPTMLRHMDKCREPEAFLDGFMQFAGRAERHGLTWAVNLLVGHPGETPATLEESRAFAEQLLVRSGQTRGWLSVDPFRLYPGSPIFTERAHWEQAEGTRFHDPAWWWSWSDPGVRSELVDPGRELDWTARVRRMHEAFGPLVRQVQARFVGQGRPEVDGVFASSLREQVELLSPAALDRLLRRGALVQARGPTTPGTTPLAWPLGLRIRDDPTRRREQAIRWLLEEGVLRTPAVAEALLEIDPAAWLAPAEVELLLADQMPPPREGSWPRWWRLRLLAQLLEQLELGPGAQVGDLAAASGYVAALCGQLVGPAGRVDLLHPQPWPRGWSLHRRLRGAGPLHLRHGQPATATARLTGPYDALWLGLALPHRPDALRALLREEGGRLVTFLGPRWRAQDLVVLTRQGATWQERWVARAQVSPLVGPLGWVRATRR